MTTGKTTELRQTPFVNEVRLYARLWLAALAALAILLGSTPPLWKRLERFETGPDYRIPYTLSRDYWLYERRLEQVGSQRVAILGDSVVWGEYVSRDGTLSHFLNEQSKAPDKFINAGVNGLFPLAFEGLIRSYGKALRGRKVIVHCNLLWLSSPKADLRTQKEERFNHADLVPQFTPRIPCYKADFNRRLAALVERHFPFSEWVTHLQSAYFDQKDILHWTLEEDGNDPARRPNVYRNPFRQITMMVPGEPPADPERGQNSSRHRPWSSTGEGSTRFEWVGLDQSLQWAAFQRLVKLLRSRHNDVFVVLGPFNEHIMVREQRPLFHHLRDDVARWLEENHVACLVPEALPSVLYADASHPLTEGYQLLAERLWREERFQSWLKEP